MKKFSLLLFITIFMSFLISFTAIDCYTAMKFKTPKVPKQSYSRQIGGNAKQKSKVEYDRGGRKYSTNVNPGQTNFIPKDAKNIQINGMRIKQGERVTISPKGASLFDD